MQQTDDPLEAMQKWSSLLQTGRERVDDLKMKTMQALDIRTNDREAILAAAREQGLAVTTDSLSLCGIQWRLV